MHACGIHTIITILEMVTLEKKSNLGDAIFEAFTLNKEEWQFLRELHEENAFWMSKLPRKRSEDAKIGAKQ